jgi:hypothetical protein
MKKSFKYLISCAVLGLFLLSAAGSDDSNEPSKPLYEDEIAIKVTAESLIKKNLRDPDSYQLIEITPKTGKVVTVRYRAKNGFGGYNVCTAVVECDEGTMRLISNE